MDERRTLSILGWTIASVLGSIFVLNAIALSITACERDALCDESRLRQVVQFDLPR
jgi:hypothetical protein